VQGQSWSSGIWRAEAPAETDCGTGMVPVDGDVDVIGEPVHQGQPAATVAGCGGVTDRGR
jgi:hypothetical protein